MYMWKVFATAYPNEFREISQYRSMKIGFPMMSVQDYLGLVNDDCVNWGVNLFLSTIYARTPDLVGISHIKNLVALDIFTPLHPSLDSLEESGASVTLNDRIIRTWCELSWSSGAFKYLRVLRLCHQDDLSSCLFEYLAAFPCLDMLIVQDCKDLTTESSKALSERYGWRTWTGGQNLLINHQESGMEYSDDIYQCYKTTLALDGKRKDKKSVLDHDTPILDFEIGIKRKSNKSQPIVFLRREEDQPHIAETVLRKRKLAGSERGAAQSSTKARKPVMKERGKKDITGMLAEFL